MGPGDTVGQALQDHPGIDGIVFTGSYEVGMGLFRSFSTAWPRPCIVEMGGKNPAIVSRHADLEEAAEGIMRSAFGFGGQKCSANSRVYVERPVHDELVRLLVEKTETIIIGDPLVRANWLGPIIDQRAVDRHQAAVAEARRDGTVFTGGEHLTDGDLARGFYVEPTVVGDLPTDHRLFRDELFAPFTAVHAVDSIDEALTLANDTFYGLTAGVYSEDPAEVQTSSTGSRRASCTSTAARARRPARGRASRRSAAGRAVARPARPGCRCTTSPSSCASRATPSSTDRAVRARVMTGCRPRRVRTGRGQLATERSRTATASSVFADVELMRSSRARDANLSRRRGARDTARQRWERGGVPDTVRDAGLTTDLRLLVRVAHAGHASAARGAAGSPSAARLYSRSISTVHSPYALRTARGAACRRARRGSPGIGPSPTSSPSSRAPRPGPTSRSTRRGRRRACRAPTRSSRSAATG